MTKVLPFRLSLNSEADLVLEFLFRATGKLRKYWETKITYDPLKKQFITWDCQCWSQIMGRQKDNNFKCKHIKISEKIATKFPEELE